jgi:hypothetical protein
MQEPKDESLYSWLNVWLTQFRQKTNPLLIETIQGNN